MKQIPMLDLKREYEYMKDDIDSAIQKCLEHQIWILGPEVKELEEKIARYINVKHCIGISSGTDALLLSLRALAIKIRGKEYWDRNDLIVTTPFTFTATGDVILRAGATPIFVDIDPKTYNIDPEKIYSALSSMTPASNVVGILPVHLYGRPCEMDSIMEIATEYGLFVVEDVAQAFGGEWKGKKLGSIGTAGAFSFFPSKNLGGYGDGGMISTNDNEIAKLVRMLIRHGGADKYNVDHIGYNARLDTLQAAIVLAKLKYIDDFIKKRRRIAETYNRGLKDLDEITITKSLPNAYHVYNQYTVSTPNRENIKAYLRDKGITTMVYYPCPLHKMKVFQNDVSEMSGNLNNAEQASRNVICLPIDPLQSKESVSYVIDCIKEILKTEVIL